MSLRDNFKTEKTKETAGTWIYLHDATNADGTVPAFKLCRMGNTNREYKARMEAEIKPYRAQFKNGNIDPAISDRIVMEVFLDLICKDWKHVIKDEKGEWVPYSKEAMRQELVDMPDLFDRLQEEAANMSNFLESAVKAEGKN